MLIVKSVMKAGEISTKDDFKTAIEKERTASEMKTNEKKNVCSIDSTIIVKCNASEHYPSALDFLDSLSNQYCTHIKITFTRSRLRLPRYRALATALHRLNH